MDNSGANAGAAPQAPMPMAAPVATPTPYTAQPRGAYMSPLDAQADAAAKSGGSWRNDGTFAYAPGKSAFVPNYNAPATTGVPPMPSTPLQPPSPHMFPTHVRPTGKGGY